MSTAGDSRAGFSLVELLVAIAVAAIVTPAIFAIIPGAFASLAAARQAAVSATDLAAFDAMFDADFTSLVPESGFEGDKTGCAFWTLRESHGGGLAPVHVEYRLGRDHVERIETRLGAYVEAAGTNSLSAAPLPREAFSQSNRPEVETFRIAAGGFRYADAQAAPEPEAEAWSNPTNAPAAASAMLGATTGAGMPRLWFRRGAP